MNIKDSQLNMRTKINRKSDFDFIVLDSEGNAIDMPSNDFTLDIWTWRSACRFRASSIGGVLNGCKNDGGKLRIYVDNPGFASGKLVGEWVSYISNEEYQDGTQRTYYLISDFGIDMVDESTQINDVQVVAMMQYIKGASAYEIACEYGFEGTEQEWLDSLALPANEAAAECKALIVELNDAEAQRVANEDVRTANEGTRVQQESARVSAEEQRIQAENDRALVETNREFNEQSRFTNEQHRLDNEAARVEAEKNRVANESTRQTNEQARVASETNRESAETNRANAEAARVEAEQARAEEFAGFAATLAAKEDVANKVTSITADADNTHYPSAKAVKTALTNLADGEDLASVGNVMKLADKAYAPTACSGMGRKYLRKNLVGGKNILTQEMLPSANTIYIIQYDYDINGATITIPENCTLDFQGGSLSNGTVTFNNTELIGKVKINSNVNGSISNTKILMSWFKAEERNNIDNYYEDTLKDVYSLLKEGHLILDGYKYIVDSIALKSNTHLDLNGSEIKQKSGTSDFPIIDGYNVSNISIINGTINGNKDNVSGNNANGIRMINSNNYDIENINFVDVRRVCIVCWSYSDNFKIKNVNAVNCGLENSLGDLIEAYQSSNFSIENSSFKEGFGVGTYVHACDNFSICNCEYSNISTDNGLTAESCKNFKLDNIKVENVKNVGIEVNNCSYFQMNNIISGNNGSHNIFISTYTPSGEAPSCKGTLNNIKTYGAPEGYNGLKITSANDIQVNNSEIADNIFLTKTEFANEYIIFSNVSCPNATIYNSENILFLNCNIVHTSSNSKVFEYPQKENIQSNIIKEEKVITLNVGESYSITIPGKGNVATATGTLDILSFFDEAPTQNTKMIISFKMIGNAYEQSVISEQNSEIPRKLSIASRSNNIIITNNQNVPLIVLLYLYGIYRP